MSATGFQRRRRELAALKVKDKETLLEQADGNDSDHNAKTKKPAKAKNVNDDLNITEANQ